MSIPSLTNHVILVTGAGDGIGRCAAKTYAMAGAQLILLGKTPKKLEALAEEIVQETQAPEPYLMPLDLKGARMEDYEQMQVAITETFGRLDGLLHNAGYVGGLRPLENYPLQTWFDVFQVNLHAPFLLTRALLPALKAAPAASVLFTFDGVALNPKAYWGAYAVAKAGLATLMKLFAEELEANTHIRVNGLEPPVTATALRKSLYPGQDLSLLAKPQDFMQDYLYWISAESAPRNGEWIECTPTQG